MRKKFRGVFPVMITPMDGNQNIDFGGIKNNIEYYIANKAAGLLPLGSTGEYVSMTKEERYQVAETVVNQVNGRVPVIVGSTAESTRDTIEYTKYAKEIGADGVMLINSYYFKPSEDEIFAHFKAVNDAVDIPIMVYNNPYVSGVDMSAELQVKIAKELSNVTNIKESSGTIQRLRDVRLQTIGHVEMFCGWEDLVLESYFAGATGWVSVAGNVFPAKSQHLFELAVEQKNYDEARKVYEEMLPFLHHLETCGKLVQVTKRAMELIGQAGGPARDPRLPLTSQEEESLKKLLGM